MAEFDDLGIRAATRDNVRTIVEQGQSAEEQVLTALLLGIALHVSNPETANRVFEAMIVNQRSFVMSLLDDWLLGPSARSPR